MTYDILNLNLTENNHEFNYETLLNSDMQFGNYNIKIKEEYLKNAIDKLERNNLEITTRNILMVIYNHIFCIDNMYIDEKNNKKLSFNKRPSFK